MKSFTSKIVNTFKSIDNEQSEGGLYALPDRCSEGRWPASHHHIFGGEFQDLDVCARLGVEGQEHWSKRIDLAVEGKSASLKFIDIALTKVRSYGNSFQLDKHYGKKWEDYSSDLKKAVSRLVKDVRGSSGPESSFLVAFIFTDSEKHAHDLIGPSTTDSFLNRYELTLTKDTWNDPYGRGIWTSVLCWAAQQKET